MTIARQLYRRCQQIGAANKLPLINRLLVTSAYETPEQNTNFGAMILDGGTVGITYVGIDNAWLGLQQNPLLDSLIGTSPLQAAELYIGEHAWQRALGMAAINAISQWYFMHSNRKFVKMSSLNLALELNSDDHIGMVGYYPPLVERIRQLSCQLTVLELNPRWLAESATDVEVTLDRSKISKCNKIICTGTTLVNHSLDQVLNNCRQAEVICVMGPTAGCLPEPLFEHGVTMVAGSRVIDSNEFIRRWSANERWSGTTFKYLLTSDSYFK